MAVHWQTLLADLAVVALFISTWLHGQFLFAGRPKVLRDGAFGLVLGAGAVVSMLLSVEIGGALFDLRLSLITLAAFFGGPIAATIAVLMAVAYRVGIVGGPAAWWATLSIVAAAVLGRAVSRLTRGRIAGVAKAGILAAAAATVSLVFGLIFRKAVSSDAIVLALMNAAATALSAFFIMRNRVVERERDLFRAAFIESPDLQYVKTVDSRFAAVNTNVALISGFREPAEMIGKTDFEITSPERAKLLLAGERHIIETGEPVLGLDEMVAGPGGEEIWYTTSKVALHNAAGDVVGIAGVTRDITARRQMRQEIAESRNQLNYVLSEVTDGIAMFDRQGTLVYRNQQYCDYFPLTSAVRRPGQNMRDILAAVVETGEQNGIPAGGEAQWIDKIAATLTMPSEEEIQLFDGRWLHARTRPTADGAALVMVSDVTKSKQAEAALVDLTEQLKLLATTDGLTALINRRALDQTLEIEVARCRRTLQPLALLMIDVDRFKAYNDIYGHPAGDAVLKQVAACLKASLRRPGDIAARYGGEEFVAILPATDEDGAFFIADNFRESLKAMNIPHAGGDRGVVTASIGVSTFTERDACTDPIELVRRADEALYHAKGAGRDRVMGWRAQVDIRPTRRTV